MRTAKEDDVRRSTALLCALTAVVAAASAGLYLAMNGVVPRGDSAAVVEADALRPVAGPVGASPKAQGKDKRPAPDPEDVVPGTWTVGLKAPVDESVRARLRSAGLRVSRVSDDGRRLVVKGALTESQALLRLAELPGAEYAEPVLIYRAAVTPTDPMYSQQWGLGRISAPLAWDSTQGTSTVTIAVVDTGIQSTHVEFSGRVVAGYDYVNNDQNPTDDEGHGTHVAGIAAAAMNNGYGGAGAAPDCTIMPVKVLNNVGEGLNSDIADGIRFAADNGAEVINLSLEGSYSDAVSSAIAYAFSKDVVVVAAAGNSSGAPVSYPAALDGVVGVSAIDSSNNLASFSNVGPQIDVTAPGVNILSTYPVSTYANSSGTSMASPFVAGTVALMRSANRALTQADVVGRLRASADDLGAPGFDNSFGTGLVNAARAVAWATTTDDDGVPGVALPASPATGAVDASTDTDDVYAFSLVAGEKIEVTLTATGIGDIDLRLFGPGTTDIGTEVPVASNTGNGNPKVVLYTATQTGVFYADVRAESGSATYALDYRIVGNDPSDDDIPGKPIPASPVAGTLARGVDNDDVFSVYLERGDRLTASLQGAEGTDFDLYLFPPGATTVNYPSEWLDASATEVYPDVVSFTALTSGTYYLDAYAASGSGAYAISWSKTAVTIAPDDDIPGVALPASPLSGSLHDTLDAHDVYYVDLVAGRTFRATLIGGSSNDFDLMLYGPDATHVMLPDAPIAGSYAPNSSEEISITAPATGRYYLDLYAYSGVGSYTLSWQRGTPPVISVTGVSNGQRSNTGFTPVVNITGAVASTITLDGAAFVSGTPVSTEGTHTLYVSARDDDGNAPSQTIVFGIDKTPPSIVVGGVTHGALYRSAVIPTYSISGLVASTVTLDGAPFVSGTSVSGEGVHTLSIAAWDDVGNSSSRTVMFTIDSTPPVISVTGVSSGESYPSTVTPVVAITGSSAQTITLDGAAFVSGTPVSSEGLHTLEVMASDPAGNTSARTIVFTIRTGPPPAAVLSVRSMSATLTAFGQSWDVTGTLTGEGMPLEGRQVHLVEQPLGLPASVVATAVTGPGGAFSFTVAPASKTAYAVRFDGDSAAGAVELTGVTVIPVAEVGMPVAPTSVFRTKSFTVSGSLAPTHTAGSGPVRVLKYLKVGTTWRYQYSVKATIINGVGGSTYSATLSLPTAGTWKLVAQHDSDAEHAQSASPERFVTVRDVIVGTPVAPSTMRKTRYYTVYGTLKPAHAKGTRPVVIRLERKVGGTYRYYKNLSATITASYSSYSRYARSIRLPYSGRWRARAYHPADSTHPLAWSSSYDYVYVP